MIQAQSRHAPRLIAFHRALAALLRFLHFRDRREICCFGLTPVQYYILETLAEGPKGVGELARIHGVAVSTMTRVLQGLRLKRLVTLRPGGEDGRRRVVALTSQGERQWRVIQQAVLDTESQIFDQLTATEQTAVVELMRKPGLFLGGGGCCLPEEVPASKKKRRTK